jgi:hypothetical protein
MKLKQKISQIYGNMEHQTPKSFRTSNRYEQKRASQQNIIVKMPRPQIKERILKVAEKKHQITNKGKDNKIVSDL